MSQQELSRIWKEVVSSRPDSRDTFKNMSLHTLHQAIKQQLDEGVCQMQVEIHEFVLFEWKGNPKNLCAIQLPAKDKGIVWFCLQFQGKAVFSNGKPLTPDHFLSFQFSASDVMLTLAADKQWGLLFGVYGASRQQLLNEFPLLRDLFECEGTVLPSFSISYQERQCLEMLSKTGLGPFSLVYHIGQLIAKLCANYVKLLQREPKEESHIQLYYRALGYIQEHYLSMELNREKIAEALNSSVRSLTRAFEGRSLSINATIMAVRLQKGRELLLEEPDLSIERIALMLHFFDAKHFTTHYKKRFYRSPREERKGIDTLTGKC